MGKFIFHKLTPAELTWEEQNIQFFEPNPNLITEIEELIDEIEKEIGKGKKDR